MTNIIILFFRFIIAVILLVFPLKASFIEKNNKK